jgi:CheY-like chemotaxis protein
VDDDSRNIFALTVLLRGAQLEVIAAESGEEALAILEQSPGVDVVLVDIMMPGLDGYQTMRAMRSMLGDAQLPLIAVTAKVGPDERGRCLDAGASDYIPKPVDTAELLVTLGKWIPAVPAPRGRIARQLADAVAPTDRSDSLPALAAPSSNGHGATTRALEPLDPPANPANAALAGRRALIVDDDFSNIFALTALLERLQLEVVSAESGAEALAILEHSPGVDIVLVDIMMPSMDGYQTMRSMREILGKTKLPLVAVTAKVEPGERQRCLDAGASDYAPKPVDTAELIAIIGKWIPAGGAAQADRRA